MSWRDVAYKDVNDASRSRTLWLLFGLLSVLFVGYAAAYTYVGDGTFAGFVAGSAGLVGGILPILGILAGYRSISDDRADGSLLLSMALPQSRTELLIGTALGRVVVLLVPTLLGLSIAGLYAALRYGTEGAIAYPWFLFATALYGASFVAAAVALSAATANDRRLTYGAVVGYLLLVVLWRDLTAFAVAFLHRFDPGMGMPDWALLVQLAQPSEAYARLLDARFDIDRASRYVGDSAPAFVDWWAALAILVGWIAASLAVGYRRFESGDL
ncbi:ABC transporter permease [Natrinema versiforme]|uniref:Copper ABC transporter permease n=1 Tax=Natrinema versiforme JCM 10478 TaxID=1227496 RepID=L9XN19_9EURY|nr:ABC transporter permease subunit [Natrinema versiforme]ELY63135.1 copper ABC transporter permease [Natrinema versiforme JCM 10478]